MSDVQETWADAEPMMTNSMGDEVPARRVPGRIKLEDQTVRLAIEGARRMHEQMLAFKRGILADIDAFMETLLAEYSVVRKGRRGGVELTSFDGLSKIEISVADSMTVGPSIQAAQALIAQCIDTWSSGANENLRTIVDDAFKAGSNGKIRVDRVKGLRRLPITDAVWLDAMAAIDDAVKSSGEVSYLRFHTRPTPDAKWEQIVLNMSAL